MREMASCNLSCRALVSTQVEYTNTGTPRPVSGRGVRGNAGKDSCSRIRKNSGSERNDPEVLRLQLQVIPRRLRSPESSGGVG